MQEKIIKKFLSFKVKANIRSFDKLVDGFRDKFDESFPAGRVGKL